ncbi:TetR/AcrR family transcriptional regulator [Streptacidiphilus pinicola]|uniref:TetR/AcrR family transcriptional regulator n=1 Tax=Streptacidiphilus pinicola TaxID=2219663 RepID=A0A2X0IXI9_9ACTN|nr:TetR/AcrR family transcriptional regulator [Streptacidiphilus pinicola]RAG82546.1 TetR/AcrR family transcriptional regulator [Streptacidiphilus pinicola]
MTSPRARLIADTAVTLLAERGLRGLTHRAVDEAAGLPPGSTSNLARTRAALLTLALEHLAQLEAAPLTPSLPVGSLTPDAARGLLAGLLVEGLGTALGPGRPLTLARFELALEAGRDGEVRARYDVLGGGFRDLAASLLAASGCPDAEGRARYLVAWCDGILFNATAGSGQAQPPGARELTEQVELMLRTLLAP